MCYDILRNGQTLENVLLADEHTLGGSYRYHLFHVYLA